MTDSTAIRERIGRLEAGAVFVPSDFFDLASPDNTNSILSRLAKRGEITRVLRGVYAKPRRSDLLGKDVPPAPDAVARAIARSNGWTIAPSGDTALNRLGLDTQVPASYSYISSGPYKSYRYGPFEIEFKRRANRDIVNRSETTSLVIQALKALGRDRVTDDTVRTLAAVIPEGQTDTVLRETQSATSWVYETIRQVKEAQRCAE